MKFSIIVPVYNVSPWLRACLDSVRSQSFTDFECICVDDGSTDGGGAILDEYAVKDPRFKIIHQPNGGEGAARNAGLEVAAGEWICFLDADDVMDDRTLETYDWGTREEMAAELVAVGLTRFADGSSPMWSDIGDVRWESFDCVRGVSAKVYLLNLWECAYKAELIAGLKFGKLKIGADRVFFSQVVESLRKAVVCDWPGYGYRQRVGSAFHSRTKTTMLLDEIRHHAILTKTIRESQKTYELAIARRRGTWLVENFAAAYYRLSSSERDRVWDEWVKEMDAVSVMKGVRPYMRAIMRIVVRTRSKMLARILIYGILWLKLHGVNRRFAVHLDEDV